MECKHPRLLSVVLGSSRTLACTMLTAPWHRRSLTSNLHHPLRVDGVQGQDAPLLLHNHRLGTNT
jgi:hypothetical protein